MTTPETTTVIEKEKEQRNYFGEWCQVTGWHCILDLYLSKNFFWKITWLLLVSGGGFFAVNQSLSMLLDFTSGDQWVTSVTYELANGKEEWPNITICSTEFESVAGYISKKTGAPLDEKNKLKFSDEHDFNISSYNTTISKEKLHQFESHLLQATIGSNGYKLCSEMIAQCGTDQFSMSENRFECCPSTNEVIYKCFSLNPEASFRLKRHSGNSLSVYYLLKGQLNRPRYSEFLMSKIKNKSNFNQFLLPYAEKTIDFVTNQLFAGSGFQVSLHLGDSDSEDDFSTKFHVTPGTRNSLALTMEKRRTVIRGKAIRFYDPKLPCKTAASFADLNQGKYSRGICLLNCLIEVCQCWPDILSALSMSLESVAKKLHLPNCEGRGAQCLRDYAEIRESLLSDEETRKNDTHLKMAKCENECLEPCAYSRVEARISSSLFVAPSQAEDFRDYINSEMAKRNDSANYTLDEVRQLTMLELYYESKQIRIVERLERLSIDELISNIGGCLGVWSGLSLLSIIQIFIYLCSGVKHSIFACKRNVK